MYIFEVFNKDMDLIVKFRCDELKLGFFRVNEHFRFIFDAPITFDWKGFVYKGEEFIGHIVVYEHNHVII